MLAFCCQKNGVKNGNKTTKIATDIDSEFNYIRLMSACLYTDPHGKCYYDQYDGSCPTGEADDITIESVSNRSLAFVHFLNQYDECAIAKLVHKGYANKGT